MNTQYKEFEECYQKDLVQLIEENIFKEYKEVEDVKED